MKRKTYITRARIFATMLAIVTGKNATAAAAIVTGITGAVMLRYDDPYVWGAAALGIAAAHWRVPTVSRGLAISNGCIGVGLSAIGGPWFASLLAYQMPANPPPVALVAFVVAVGWGYVFKSIAPIIPKVIRSVLLSWLNVKDRRGEK